MNFPIFIALDSFSLLNFYLMFIHSSSMLGSDSSTTDYPGRIPSGLDTPSDAVVDEKLANDKPVSGST